MMLGFLGRFDDAVRGFPPPREPLRQPPSLGGKASNRACRIAPAVASYSNAPSTRLRELPGSFPTMINQPADEPAGRSSDRPESVAKLLGDLRDGRREAFEELFPLVYQELRELAHRHRQSWQGDETLNTTALVHEAYLKLVDQRRASYDSEAHFLAAAAKSIRHILINYARDRRAQKRGGGWQQISLSDDRVERAFQPPAAGPAPSWDDRIVALDEALQRLAGFSERQGRIVECRFFGGMTIEQTATALGLSTATVTRGWVMAQAWLRRDLGEIVSG
jgi:RNA polymerase sigma factor (TIGR02999 family)